MPPRLPIPPRAGLQSAGNVRSLEHGCRTLGAPEPGSTEDTAGGQAPSGDCIVGTSAFSGCHNIPYELKQKLCNSNTDVIISIIVGNHQFKIIGKGHKSLILTHPHDIVIRKSDFVCPRTLAIKCNFASDSIPRDMVKLLQNPKTKGLFIIEAK